jgi:hypothetical protein
MDTRATIFLVICWGLILSLNLFCFSKVLRKKKSR